MVILKFRIFCALTSLYVAHIFDYILLHYDCNIVLLFLFQLFQNLLFMKTGILQLFELYDAHMIESQISSLNKSNKKKSFMFLDIGLLI